MAKGQALEAKRGNIFLIEEENDKIDLRLITDKTHALYDERVEDEPEEELVANIKAKGVLEPIVVTKGGVTDDGLKTIVLVVAGRKRTKAWQEANRQLRAEEKPTLPLPAMVKYGTDVDLLEMMLAENQLRFADNAMNIARKLGMLLSKNGGDLEAAAAASNMPVSSVEMHLRLLELHPDVQALVRAGDIAASSAAELAKLPAPEQWAAAEKAMTAAKHHGGRAVSQREVKAAVQDSKRRIEGRLPGDGKVVDVGRKNLRRIAAYLLHKAESARLGDARKLELQHYATALQFASTGVDEKGTFAVPEDFDPDAKAAGNGGEPTPAEPAKPAATPPVKRRGRKAAEANVPAV